MRLGRRMAALLLGLGLALAGAGVPGSAAAVDRGAKPVPVPVEARAVDTSNPTRWIGDGTPQSCTSRAVVAAVRKGGIIRFRCGPDPVRIEMKATAKVVNTSKRVVLDGGGLVTLSGGGERRILYQNTCDPDQVWTTSHCDDQATPRLVVQNLTFARGNSTGQRYDGGGGGAIFARGGRLKIVDSRFVGNRCDRHGPDLGGAAVRALSQHDGPSGLRHRQHLHPGGVQQRWRAEQHRRLLGGLQQHLHRQPGGRATAPTRRGLGPGAAAPAEPSTPTATGSACCWPARR